MRRLLLVVGILGWTGFPAIARAQFGGEFGGRRDMGGFSRDAGLDAPKLPGPELDGPPDSLAMRELLQLNDSQATRYAQVYDSFMVATRPQRDSAQVAKDKMNQRLNEGDRAAALFYAERLQDLGKYLRERQDKFDDQLDRLLTRDQRKQYHQWEEQQQRLAEDQQKEDALRWRIRPDFVRMGAAPDESRAVLTTTGVAAPTLGSQVVRVGRTLYVAGQEATDSSGAIVGGTDLGAQTQRAFANLATVLESAHASLRDVIQVTLYVVNYDATDLAALRSAVAVQFPAGNAPIVTVLGVGSLDRPGARIAIQATAQTRGGGMGSR
jgi:enamine deaminase RidA (YjgF/YER057c/UK114 family)/Spy/CpxP family protein refolding chaperone